MASISKYLTSSNGKQLSQRAYNAYLKIREEEENEEKKKQELLKQQTALNDEYKTVRGELGIDTLNEQVESTRRVLGGGDDGLVNYFDTVLNTLFLGLPQTYLDQENKKQYEGQYQSIVDELKKNETAYKSRIGEENYDDLLIELGQSAPATAGEYSRLKQDVGLAKLQVARNSAWDQYAKDGTMVSLEKAEALDKELRQYQLDNPDTGKSLFSPTAQYIPQGLYYAKKNIPAAAAAVLTTGLTGSATAGKTTYGLGALLTGYEATYEQTRGGEFGDMVSLGIPEDIALEASSDSAFWQALIEQGEAGKDIYQLFTLPQGEGVINTIKEFFKDWGMNIVSEGLEEGSQSIVGFVHEWNAMERAGLDTSSYNVNRMLEQAWEEAKGGAQVGATLYLAEGLPHIAIGQGVNAISGKSSIQTAPLSNITVEELPLIVKEDSVTVDRKALKPLISDIYDLNIKAAQSENTSLGNATAEQLIIGKQRMTSEKTLNTLADGIDESLNKTVANNRQVMTDTQKQNYQAVLNEEQESIRQSNPLFDKIELTVANKISTVQDNVRKFFERLGVNIVFYDSFSDEAVDTAGDRIYYNSNGFYRNGNTIYVNRLNSDVKSLLASGGHEAAHIILNNDPKILENMKKQYSPSDVAQYISDRNIVLDFEPGETAYEAGLKEMFSDSVGELLSTRQAVAKIENATKGFKGNAKQVLDNFMQNAVGVQSENTSLTQYDLEGESILSGNQLSQEEQDTVLTKLTGKQVSSSKYQSLYDNMVADNKSEKSIRSALAARIGALPNSGTVSNELKKLKQNHTTKQSASVSKNSRVKQSARITKKDRIIKNQRKKINRLEKKIDKQRTADEMWIKRTERAKLLKKIDTKDQKILRLKDREQIRKLEAKDKAVRERMQKRVSEMRQTLRDTIRKFKNSEAFKYLSKEEQEQFKESFGSYYLKANSKTELTRMKEYVKSMIAQMLEEDPNIVISNKIREIITAPGQKTFSEVQSLEDLEELYKSLKDVIDQAKGIKKLVGLERSQDVDKVRTGFVNATQERYNEVEDKKSLRSKKREQREASVGGKIVNALGTGLKITKDNIAQLYVKKLDTLKTQLLYMAGGNRNSKMMELYENLQEGVSRERTAYVGLNKVLSSFLNDKEYAELRKSLREKADWKDMGIKVKDIAGREHELRLNEALLISLAMHSMQDQSLAHIGGRISDIVVENNGRGRPLKRQGGGLTIPNEELLKAGKVSEAIKAGYIVKLSPKQINEIVGKQIDGNGNITFTKLTKQQNEFISGLQNFFEKTAEYTNEVYKIMHGRDLSIVENYFPIMSNKAYIYRGFDENSSLVSSNEAESWGIIDNSGFTKERNENAFNPIVLERVTDVITRMINGVSKYYGYNLALYNNNVLLESRNADGISANDMFNKIDNTFEDNYKTLTGFLSGKLRQPNDMFAKFRGKHAEFTLGLNPSVWVKQLLSVPTTMKYFKTSDLISFIAGGEAKLHSAMRDYLEANNISERGKVLHNFLSFLTNDIEYRSLGFGQVDAEDLKNNKSLFERLDLLKGIARMDMLGVDTVSRMFLYSELNNRGLLDGGLTQLSAEQTDEIFDDIGRRLEEFLRETQPDYSQVNRPNIVRNRGVVSRFLTMYSTATLQMFNNMASSMSELRYAIKTKDKKLIGQMTSRMIKSALGVLVASAGSAAISRMFDKLLKQKDDDDDYDYGKEVIVTLLAPTLILDDIARGALGLAQYDSQTPELAAYDAIIGLAGDIRDLITGGEEVKFKQLESIIKNIGLATGIPTRDLMNLTKTTLLMSGSDLYYQIALRENQYAYKKWLDGNMGQNVKDFYSAYVETRDAKLESKYGYQKGAGIKTGEEGSKKKSFQKALENVFPGDKAKVNEYMVILGGYKK